MTTQPARYPSKRDSIIVQEKIKEYQPSTFMRGSKFPIYWAESPKYEDKLAMKFYAYENDEISQSFKDESQFYELEHDNIITFLKLEPKYFTEASGETFKFSYVLMELAPYGDFADLMETVPEIMTNEKIMRTYFHQLVEGVEYLHKKKVAHLDIKIENLLLGKDFQLKICDFETSYKETDSEEEKAEGCLQLRSKGTINYRPPEMVNNQVKDPFAIDNYSVGILLFIMKFGILPYMEDQEFEDINLFELMQSEPEKLWNLHEELENLEVSYDQDYKELFFKLVHPDPTKRATIEDIKKSSWYNKPILSNEELKEHMSQYKEQLIREGC